MVEYFAFSQYSMVEFSDGTFNLKMSKLTIILPCAGEGTRLSLPYPKEIHSIEKNKSLIDYSFDLFQNYGRRDVEFVITLNENKTELINMSVDIKQDLISHSHFLILQRQSILDQLRVLTFIW